MFYGADWVSTGAQNDIQQATKMARNMVTKWGLSEKAGPVLYSEDEGEIFAGAGQGGGHKSHVSEETAELLDAEIRKILDDCYAEATRLLEENRDKMELMKDALMEYETIDAHQIDQIMKGEVPDPPKDWEDGDGGASADSASSPEEPDEDASDDQETPERKPDDPLGGSVH